MSYYLNRYDANYFGSNSNDKTLYSKTISQQIMINYKPNNIIFIFI